MRDFTGYSRFFQPQVQIWGPSLSPSILPPIASKASCPSLFPSMSSMVSYQTYLLQCHKALPLLGTWEIQGMLGDAVCAISPSSICPLFFSLSPSCSRNGNSSSRQHAQAGRQESKCYITYSAQRALPCPHWGGFNRLNGSVFNQRSGLLA